MNNIENYKVGPDRILIQTVKSCVDIAGFAWGAEEEKGDVGRGIVVLCEDLEYQGKIIWFDKTKALPIIIDSEPYFVIKSDNVILSMIADLAPVVE
jgi:hypothetical protein